MPIPRPETPPRPLTASAQRRKAPSDAAAGATAAMASSSAAQPILSDSAWLEIKGVVAVLAAGDLPLTHNLMPAAVNAVLAALERREQRVSRGHSRGL